MIDDDFRNQVFSNLSMKETDELIEIWQNNNRSEWSDLAFEVIQQILRSRIGQLPPQDPPNDRTLDQDMNGERDNQLTKIVDLAESGDINGLVQIMNYDPDTMIGLEAAMALAQLEDERGLDFLIEALRNPDEDIISKARKILVELNHPRGNIALQTD